MFILAQYLWFAIGWPLFVVVFLIYAAAVFAVVLVMRRWRLVAWFVLMFGLLELALSLFFPIVNYREKMAIVPPNAGNHREYIQQANLFMLGEFLYASPVYVPAILFSLPCLWKRRYRPHDTPLVAPRSSLLAVWHWSRWVWLLLLCVCILYPLSAAPVCYGLLRCGTPEATVYAVQNSVYWPVEQAYDYVPSVAKLLDAQHEWLCTNFGDP